MLRVPWGLIYVADLGELRGAIHETFMYGNQGRRQNFVTEGGILWVLEGEITKGCHKTAGRMKIGG